MAWLLVVSARALAQLERSRAGALLGVAVDDPVPPLAAPHGVGRLAERLRPGAAGGRLPPAGAPRGLLTSIVAGAAWCGSAALLLLPLYVRRCRAVGSSGCSRCRRGRARASRAQGLSGLAVAAVDHPRARAARRRHRPLAARPPARRRAGERLSRLETSRAAALDSAEAERRRIERTSTTAPSSGWSPWPWAWARQERLETNPRGGAASSWPRRTRRRRPLPGDPRPRAGIHPVILEDRGLDAALSALVARTPVPVDLRVEVAERPPSAVESAAYFVVAEALTNVTRHAHATRAAVTIARTADRLVLEVRDDGVGGADPDRGTGLHGLRDRVTALGGTMHLISPPGGPTTLLVELPCGS